MISCENSLLNESIILAPKNIDVSELNNEILHKINGPTKIYLSVDSAEDENNENLTSVLPLEFLNSLSPNGLPPHRLQLKISAIMMLLRNLNVNEGLCNGTRLIVKDLKEYTILAEILSGSKAGTSVLIPRIDLSPSIEEVPFHMKRRQFPVKLSHAMTLIKHKANHLKKSGFSYPILYLAMVNYM